MHIQTPQTAVLKHPIFNSIIRSVIVQAESVSITDITCSNSVLLTMDRLSLYHLTSALLNVYVCTKQK